MDKLIEVIFSLFLAHISTILTHEPAFFIGMGFFYLPKLKQTNRWLQGL